MEFVRENDKIFANESITSHVIAITNRHLCTRPLIEQVERVCKVHPRAIILREKDLSKSDYFLLAQEILKICKSYGVPCILHTHVDTARELGRSSIHLPLPLLREYDTELSGFQVIGTSIHSVEEALEAERLGATYLTAGHIYATDCKKGVPPRGLAFLRSVCEKVSLPVYAIGGIHLDEKQMAEVMGCGAKGGCIMSGMMTI